MAEIFRDGDAFESFGDDCVQPGDRWMMTAEQTVEAVGWFHTEYPGWGIGERFQMWNWGQLAFTGEGGFGHFEKLYGELRRGWNVFRTSRPGPRLSCDEAYALLRTASLDHPRLHSLSLTELRCGDVPELRALWGQVGRIKTNQNGPSLMAMSKFLHFWNPRLFVIVDVQEVECRALSGQKVRAVLRRVQTEVERRHGKVSRSSDPTTGAGRSYSAILLWLGQLLRDNPSILTHFRNYVGIVAEEGGLPGGGRYGDFAGAAAELFLLGWAHACGTA